MTTQAAVCTPGTTRTRARAAWLPAGVALAAVALFIVYWRQSGSAPVSSDGASNVLQARAMLHGNLFLHGWRVSDVSFYTTELPQYALIAAVVGSGAWVVHAGAAMTYTLLVLLSGWLAKGRAPGRIGWTRALLAAGIMLAPQLSATQILLESPDHVGTCVPVLVAWLVIDRVTPDRWQAARRAVPLVVFVLLTWTMIADSVVLITFIAPLVLVCLVRACPGLIRRGERLAAHRYELSLAGAAAVAGGLGLAAPRVIAALGGYRQAPVELETSVAMLGHQAWVTWQGLLELFGANWFDAGAGLGVAFAALHVAGAMVVTCAVGLALARFSRVGELLTPVFAAAIVLTVASYMFSLHAADIADTREIAAVLPLGAVLAGRMLAEPLLRVVQTAGSARVWLLSGLCAVCAGYLGALAYGAAQPSAPPANQPLAAWLVAHRLTDGLAGYWQANSTTLASGGRVHLSGVTVAKDGDLVPYEWETDDESYNQSRHDATFMVAGGPAQLRLAQPAALRTFGRPRQVYRYRGYLIMVWDANLLARLGHPGIA